MVKPVDLAFMMDRDLLLDWIKNIALNYLHVYRPLSSRRKGYSAIGSRSIAHLHSWVQNGSNLWVKYMFYFQRAGISHMSVSCAFKWEFGCVRWCGGCLYDVSSFFDGGCDIDRQNVFLLLRSFGYWFLLLFFECYSS